MKNMILILLILAAFDLSAQTPSGYNPIGGKTYFRDTAYFQKMPIIKGGNAPAALSLLQLVDTFGRTRWTTSGACSYCYDSTKAWKLNGNVASSTSFLGTTNSKDLIFKTKNVEAMRIDTLGNVGIGTATPAYKFDLLGGFHFLTQGSGSYYEFISNTSTCVMVAYDSVTNATTTIGFQGINPKLDRNSGNQFTLIDDTTTEMSLTSTILQFIYDVDNGGIKQKISGSNAFFLQTGTTSSFMDGNVGIGTSSPTAKLHVVGEFLLDNATEGDGKVLTSDANGLSSWGRILHDTTYTPTLTNGTNVQASTPYAFHCSRVGSTVTCGGTLDIDMTATGNFDLDISLPYASNFDSVYDLSGVSASAGHNEYPPYLTADTTDDRATIYGDDNDTGNHAHYVQFTYTIK